jgi:hypothetical protein
MDGMEQLGHFCSYSNLDALTKHGMPYQALGLLKKGPNKTVVA